ncbi:MAG: oxidoreductase [Firmicutes bacterium]|nr:oxidoreductase [Bacillota bacterium]
MWKLITQRLRTPRTTLSVEELLADKGLNEGTPDQTLVQSWNRLRRTAFGGSVHIRHVDTGSCNACEWELTALLNPVYDIQRLGIDFVASPRHADVLVVTGGLTRNLAEALQLTYEATAHPKAVLAIGACACGTGLIGRTYAQQGDVALSVPVLASVSGCPPQPADIIRGLIEVATKLEEARVKHGHGTPAI